MQLLSFRGAVFAAATLVVSFIQPSAAFAHDPTPPAPVVQAAQQQPATSTATAPALSGSAWIAQGTTIAPSAPPAPAVTLPLSSTVHADSLMQLVGDMPVEHDLTPDQKCLAQAVYFEARGEPIEGQLAVAEVVINRAKSGLYPDNFCDVITQPAQFSFVRHGRIPAADETSSAWQRAVVIAEIAQQSLWRSKAADALYFHATYVNPSWAHQKVELAQIDTHIFYR